MQTLVADPAEQTQRLNEVTETLRQVSAASETEAREHAVDKFLDEILSRQAYLAKSTGLLQALEPKVRELLWFAAVNDAMLQSIRELIDSINHAYGLLVRNRVLISRDFDKHKISKAGLTAFRKAIDTYKELADDLTERFFTAPQDPEFQALMSELSELK